MFKIAFLFLTISGMYHEGHWQDFFKNNDGRYSIYIHSKESLKETNSLFKNYEIPAKVETTWENTMRAQIALLKEALKDLQNEKFVFLSESTIPLQDFDTVYDAVMATDKSIFPYCENVHQDKTRSGTFWNYHNYQPHQILYPIPAKLQFKNPQWVILNRKHAQLMVDDTLFIDIVTRYICDNEHYPSTFLAIKGLLHSEVMNLQTTYDDWIATSSPSSPYTFTNLKDADQFKIIVRALQMKLYSQQMQYLFGRKFAKECDLSPLDSYLAYRIEWK